VPKAEGEEGAAEPAAAAEEPEEPKEEEKPVSSPRAARPRHSGPGACGFGTASGGTADSPPCLLPIPHPSQEMTLEEYEAQLAEKKALLNKKSEVKTVTEDFKGMKVRPR